MLDFFKDNQINVFVDFVIGPLSLTRSLLRMTSTTTDHVVVVVAVCCGKRLVRMKQSTCNFNALDEGNAQRLQLTADCA